MPILLKKIKEEYNRTLVKSKGNKSDKLYIHLYKMLSKMLIKTEIPENSVLPPTRVLSTELGLSRSTVLRAYDMLVLDGLLITKRSSGYQVKPKEVLVDKPEMTNETTEFQLSEIGKSFLKLSNFSISNSQENLAFSPGLPPLDIFPVSQWKNLTNMYWKEIKFSNLTYSPSSGIDKLKYNIAAYLSLTRNIKCEPSQVFIMSGSLQSLYLLGTMLVNPGEHVFLEDPTFPNVHAIFKGLMAKVHGIPLDKKGMSIELMEAQKSKPKLIHVTPSCHYPSGLKMPLDRRLELIEYANENKALIIENDYEHELNNWENPLPSIFSLDQNQNSIYLGTFNRVLHPSLRIGYMIVPHRLKHPLEVMMKHSHRFVAPSIQFVLNQFIEKKVLHNHLNKMIAITKERKLFFIQTFEEIFKAAGFTIVPNDVLSLQTLVKLDSTYIDKDLVAVLNQHNLSAHSYNKCFISNSKEQGLIMGHCSIQKHIIKNKLIRMHNTIFEM
ncbi:MAG: PLP-dependent aminotransferase family protein [Bacteroidia bacterium]